MAHSALCNADQVHRRRRRRLFQFFFFFLACSH